MIFLSQRSPSSKSLYKHVINFTTRPCTWGCGRVLLTKRTLVNSISLLFCLLPRKRWLLSKISEDCLFLLSILIISPFFLFFFFAHSHPRKLWPQLACKYASFASFVYVWLVYYGLTNLIIMHIPIWGKAFVQCPWKLAERFISSLLLFCQNILNQILVTWPENDLYSLLKYGEH